MFARIAACAIVIAASSPASAAIWTWGCVGKLGTQQISYDRFRLIVEPAKSSRIKLRQLINSETDLQTEEGIRFETDDGRFGFEKTMGFKRKYKDAEQKLILTELSSRQVSNRKGHVGRATKSPPSSRRTTATPLMANRCAPSRWIAWSIC